MREVIKPAQLKKKRLAFISRLAAINASLLPVLVTMATVAAQKPTKIKLRSPSVIEPTIQLAATGIMCITHTTAATEKVMAEQAIAHLAA